MPQSKPPQRAQMTRQADKVKVLTNSASSVSVAAVIPTVAHSVGVFGDEQRATHWLQTPLAMLAGLSPVQFMDRGGDPCTIDTILTRIEHNIPS